MTLKEALNKSNKARRATWSKECCATGDAAMCMLTIADAIADDWEPLIPRKTGLTFIQAVESGCNRIARPEWCSDAAIIFPEANYESLRFIRGGYPGLHKEDYLATDWCAWTE